MFCCDRSASCHVMNVISLFEYVRVVVYVAKQQLCFYMQPVSIVSYNHLGNNDGKNLSAPKQFRSKEVSAMVGCCGRSKD